MIIAVGENGKMDDKEKTVSDVMGEISVHYLMNNCEHCPFYDISKTCDSKPINCTWLALHFYFESEKWEEKLANG